MKLKFKKQQFQTDAVNAAAELFRGQTGAPSVFGNKVDLTDYAQGELLGYGNSLTLTREQLQTNLNAVQEKNLLPLTDINEVDGKSELRFNIEMETGKT